MRVLERFVEPERDCVYLPDRQARLETFLMLDVSPEELEVMLGHGYRRFGPSYFRPACRSCDACDSLRIPVATFAPKESQRRAAKKCARYRREVSAPVVDDQRLELYRKWHRNREHERGWEENPIDAQGYAIQLAFPHPAASEVTFWDGEELVGVGLWDETPHASSAVFFFSDPDRSRDSLGVANVVLGIEAAKAAGKEHVYLGYRVEGCASLAYKSRFGPHEQLQGRPSLREPSKWSSKTS
ncbi:MAG: arginyltransferase [Polyangiales bacterium]